jgi:hypothetical protein
MSKTLTKRRESTEKLSNNTSTNFYLGLIEKQDSLELLTLCEELPSFNGNIGYLYGSLPYLRAYEVIDISELSEMKKSVQDFNIVVSIKSWFNYVKSILDVTSNTI